MTNPLISTLQKYWKPATRTAFTFITLLIFLFFGALFYLYVSENYTYLVERNFRLLATWSQELTETFANYERSLRFRMQEAESGTVSGSSQQVRSRSTNRRSPDEGLILQGFSNDFIVDGETDSQVNMQDVKAAWAAKSQADLSQLPFMNNVQITLPSPITSRSPADAAMHPEKTTVTFSLPPGQQVGKILAEAQSRSGTISATIDLDGLTKNVASETIFDDVLLADPSGAVVFQRNPSTLQFLNLTNLLAHQQPDSEWFAGFFQTNGKDQAKTLDQKQLNFLMQNAPPSHFQVTVGGNTYDVFIQAVAFPPIVTPSGNTPPQQPWLICGLIPSSTFQNQYLAIPFTVLMFCLFLLVSAFLALPLLSLTMMNPRERLTRFSVVSLLITNILGAGIGTLFLLDLGFYRHMVGDFHERLRETASSISAAFQIQLDRMVWQLDRYDQQFSQLEDLQHFPDNADSQSWLARVGLPDPCLDAENQPVQFCFPRYSVAFWVDGKGILRETWTQSPNPYVRGTHDLSQRDYVSKVQASSKALSRRFIDGRWLAFYAQPLISLESSTRSLVVSMPHRSRSGSHAHSSRWIAALQSEEFSLLKDPVLSPGVGYAILDDRTGLVLFHSNSRRMLRENFLEETDNHPEIAALIHARAEGEVEGDYWGIGHRFALQPLEGLPWTLVVFESKEAFRTINFEMLILSLCLFTFYIAGLLLWVKLLSYFYRYDSSGRRIRWTWPRQSSLSAYYWLATGQLALWVIGLAILAGLDWQEELQYSARLALVALPFLSIWVVIRVLWKYSSRALPEASDKGGDPWTLLQTRTLQSAFTRFALTTFLLLGVFPAILFFKVSHDREMRLYAQHHLWGLFQSLNAHTEGPWLAIGSGETPATFQFTSTPSTCLIPGCQAGPDLPSSLGCTGLNEPHAAEMVPYALQGIYPSFPLSTCVSFAPTRTVSLRPITPSWLDHLHQLIRKSSLQNPMNKESWGFLHRFPGNSSMTWSHTLSEGRQDIQLRVDTFENGTGAPSTLTSLFLSVWMGAYPWNLSLRFLGYLGFGFLLIGMGYIILRYMISRIYALPSFYHRSHEVGGFHQVHSGQTLRHLLVLGPPGSGKSHLIQGLAPDCAVLDLHATYGKEIWADSLLQTIPTGTRAVIVDHFEYQWDIQTHQREKGKLIECLLSHHYQVCILSTRDPLEWTKLPWPDALNTTPDSTQAYWVDLLGSFGFIHFVPSRMETLFRQWLQPQSEPSGSTGTGSTLPVKHWLQQESQPSLQLERIGQWIRSFQEWATWTPGQMKEQFLRIGWPYYQALWQSCSLSEKLSLYHLAQDGYLHADNPDLTSLSQKGLIHLVPDLQLMNDSFRLFVLQIGTNLQIAHWEKQTHQDTWSKLKGPFLLIFGAILLFFFFTQQEFKSSFITLISLLPILLPALPELPFLFSSQKHVPPQS